MQIFVNHLPPEICAEDLEKLFSEFGKVSDVKLVLDPETHRPRGFGFVTMPNRYHTWDAIDNLDMTYLAGKIIQVKESRPRPRNPKSPHAAKDRRWDPEKKNENKKS